jgi:ubiquinone/menaquinone biosynthesis C-methylase UbiE
VETIRSIAAGRRCTVRRVVDPEIMAYYQHGFERDRLASGGQRIEFLRMWDLLKRHLPPQPAQVLDVGGGAGAYAIPLASAGYEVHLIDPVPLHVEQASEASREAATPLASITVGDAREFHAADASCDAVLLLGPLYHLTSKDDRITALREARRVVRRGGIVVAKALSRFYPIFEELAAGRQPGSGWLEDTVRFLGDGLYRNPTGDPAHFTTSYFHRPEELPSETRDAGLVLRQFVAVSGSVKLFPDLSRWLGIAEGHHHVLALLRLLEAESSLIGMSQNFVAIAQAPAEG